MLGQHVPPVQVPEGGITGTTAGYAWDCGIVRGRMTQLVPAAPDAYRGPLPDVPLWNPHVMGGRPYVANALDLQARLLSAMGLVAEAEQAPRRFQPSHNPRLRLDSGRADNQDLRIRRCQPVKTVCNRCGHYW